MNKTVLMGRLVRDPEVRYSQGSTPVAVTRYTLAVNRRFKKEGQPEADFISCVALGKNGEFADKWFEKGMKVVVSGRLQTGSYEKDGVRHYTTDVLIEEQDFAESKGAKAQTQTQPQASTDGFVALEVPDNVDELPFG